jgi:hypothetical protein
MLVSVPLHLVKDVPIWYGAVGGTVPLYRDCVRETTCFYRSDAFTQHRILGEGNRAGIDLRIGKTMVGLGAVKQPNFILYSGSRTTDLLRFRSEDQINYQMSSKT